MYIDNVLIDSVDVFPSTGHIVHVEHFRRQLLLRHSARLATEDQAPVFTLEQVPSRVNQKFTSLAEAHDLKKVDDPLFPRSKKHKE